MADPLKINLILGHAVPFPPTKGGGIETLYSMLTEEWTRQGHRVTCYSRKTNENDFGSIDEGNIRHIKVKGFEWSGNRVVNVLNSLRWCLRLRRRLEPGDIALYNSLFSFIICNREYGIPCTTLHRTPKRWIKYYLKFYDRVYGGSRAVIKQAKEICGELPNAKSIYNCIEMPAEHPGIKKYGKGSPLSFLYLGRFVWDKGLEYLIKGFHDSLRRFPDNKLVILGPQTAEEGADPVFFKRMKRYIEDNGLTSNISLKKPVYDKNELYDTIRRDADVFAVPTISGETFSIAILEAMALGKPVLTSDFPPMTEAVDHQVNGYISRLRCSESLASGIGFFSENTERMEEFQRASLDKVRNFTVKKIAQEYIDDFRHLIDTHQSTH